MNYTYTYKEIKRSVLSLIRQYTLSGDAIALSYNNQEDYVNQIALRINEALTEIRTTVKPDSVQTLLQNPTKFAGFRKYRLPNDCIGIKSGSVMRVHDGHITPAHGWRTVGDRDILIPDDGAEYYLTYNRVPRQLPSDPADDFPITEDPEVMQAAIYFAAAQLVRMDSAFDYASLYNEYSDRTQRMAPAPHAEIDHVVDVYQFQRGGY